MAGRLTTHVLDTAAGRPAAGVRVELRRVGEAEPLAHATTNADGRTDAPLLEGEALTAATYELTFHVGAHFPGGFYDAVPVRFVVADPEAHHHVPLLASPWSYTTYRGS
jgi:5-hydroxyisourate hydrolase